MATTLNFREILDLPEWRPLAQPVGGAGAGNGITTGCWFAEDLRNSDYANPFVYYCGATTTLYAYNIKNDAWVQLNSAQTSGGSFNSGHTSVFVPSLSPSGSLAAGGSTTKIILSTALPASVTTNQLANRGDGKGFIVRVISNSALAAGVINERRVISNTSGTTPTIILDSALTFTPASGDTYEFLAGSFIFLNTGAIAANQFRRFDCLTSAYSSLATANLISTVPATGNFLIPLDESYVPYTRNVGEGMIVGAGTYGQNISGSAMKCLTATSTAAGSITGQASAGDAAIVANQYRNYQIRIVEDTVIPTAVGQRRRITSHTAGTSPVYTLASNWTVTPTITCKYVIENWSDSIIGFMGGTTTIYNYSISANTWDTTTWVARGSSAQTTSAWGCHVFGVMADELNTLKSSNIFCFRGSSNTPDILDIAGSTSGSWTNAAVLLDISGTTYDSFNGGQEHSHFSYNPHTQNGKYIYCCPGVSNAATTFQRPFARVDANSLVVEKIAGPKLVSGTTGTTNGKYSFFSMYQDGATKISFYNTPRPNTTSTATTTDYYQLMITR